MESRIKHFLEEELEATRVPSWLHAQLTVALHLRPRRTRIAPRWSHFVLALGVLTVIALAIYISPRLTYIRPMHAGPASSATNHGPIRMPVRDNYYITVASNASNNSARVYLASTDKYVVWTSPVGLKPARQPDPTERASDISSIWTGPVAIYGAPIEGPERDLSRNAKELAVLQPQESAKIYRNIGYLKTIRGHIYLRINLVTDLKMYPFGYRMAIVDQDRLIWLPYVGAESGGIFSGELYTPDAFAGWYFQPDAYSYYIYDFVTHRLVKLQTSNHGKLVALERSGRTALTVMFQDGTRLVVVTQ